MRNWKSTLLLSAVLLGGGTTAAFAWHNGGVSGAKVVDITTLQDGSFYVLFDKDICDSGVNKVGFVYTNTSKGGVSWTKEGADMLFRTAMSAKLSGATLKVYADNSGSGWGCQMGALKIE